ncbi:hypothetical protein H6763_03370 [Candidatus Nomurabacteria bacterium]|nr:hypothetical protein [Candidatus Nomurabacteria bacterium]
MLLYIDQKTKFTNTTQVLTLKGRKLYKLAKSTYNSYLPYHTFDHAQTVLDRLTAMRDNIRLEVLTADYLEILCPHIPCGAALAEIAEIAEIAEKAELSSQFSKLSKKARKELESIEHELFDLMVIATLFHDAGHEGYRFAQEIEIKNALAKHTSNNVSPRSSSIDLNLYENLLSTEEKSVQIFEGLTKNMLEQFQIEIVSKMILATAFGQDDPILPKWKQRKYAPKAAAERIVAFCDLASFLEGAEKVLLYTINVKQEAILSDPENTRMFGTIHEMCDDVIEHFYTKSVKNAIRSVENDFTAEYVAKLYKRYEKTLSDMILISEYSNELSNSKRPKHSTNTREDLMTTYHRLDKELKKAQSV